MDRYLRGEIYLELCYVCGTRSACPRAQALERAYAAKALARPDEIPVEHQLELVWRTQRLTEPYLPDGSDEEFRNKDLRAELEFATRRERALRYYIDAWRRLESEIDPDWDETDIDFGPHAMGFAPSEDESPADTAQRMACVKKFDNYNRQCKLRRLKSEFMEPWLTGAADCYSYRPYAIDELEAVLRRHQFDRELTEKIVGLARANVAKAQEEARAHAEDMAAFRRKNGKDDADAEEPPADP